jgi:sec-independent protein translocase protein TatC
MGWLDGFIKRRGGNEAEMSFLDHLEELRWHIIKSLIAIIIAGIIIFVKTTYVFDHIIFAPKNPDFWTFQMMCKLATLVHISSLCVGTFNVAITNIDMSGQFMISLQNAFTLGLIVTFPYVLWQAWQFMSPALYEQERSKVSGIVISGSFLFYLGVVFGYYLIVPFTVYFLGTYQVSAQVPNQINLSSYIETVTGLSFACGLVFEFPLVIYLLAIIGLATHQLLSQYRKYAFVIILFIAAVITPSPDMVSQTLVAVPLFGLYEIGILISRRVAKRRIDRPLKEEEEYVKEEVE